MADFNVHDAHIPTSIISSLTADYFRKGERFISALHEAYIPRIDFRWIILTNKRLFIAIRHLIVSEFQEITLDGMDYEYTKGFLFDVLLFQHINQKYRATFYFWDRPYVEEFIRTIRATQEQNDEGKRKGQLETQQEPVQTLKDLADLHDRGMVTDEEFEKLKEILLKRFRDEEK